jgi:hypothetical protein
MSYHLPGFQTTFRVLKVKTMKILLIVLAALLTLIFIVLVLVLFVPFKLDLDSRKGTGWVGWNKWLSARIEGVDGMSVRIWLFGWRRRFNLFEEVEKAGRRSQKKMSRKKGNNTSKRGLSFIKLPHMWSFIGKVKIEELRLYLDTNDYILNAWLVPAFEAVRWHFGHDTRINFVGVNEIRIKLKAKIIHLLKGVMR